jgi:tetratricopeptide (TPR) repeat protein
MRRTLALLVVLVVLFGTTLWIRSWLETQERRAETAELLYLPKGPFLRALALGHEETLADLMYIWALNYYGKYDHDARRGYLDAVFSGAITELDPRFTEAYLIGAMIMSIEYKQPIEALRLYDKGLAAMPENWELAYWAGWECYAGKQYLRARDYWQRASGMPGAPAQLMRLAARMLEKSGDLDAAIVEYERLLDEAQDETTRAVVLRWLERMKGQRQAATEQPQP